MPTYEYRCGSCAHEFEEFQSMSAEPLRVCPQCEDAALERLIGAGAGLIFKGSGFYETDYRSEGYKKAAEKDKGKAGGDGGGEKASKTSEAKPDAGKAGGGKSGGEKSASKSRESAKAGAKAGAKAKS